MKKKKVFISFDYDNDLDIKGALVSQAKDPNSPFKIVDMSIKEPITSKWKENARSKIKNCDCVIILCGRYTEEAKGVTAELTIAQEEEIPYYLLCGRKDGNVQKPLSAKSTDIVYKWKWKIIKELLQGKR